MPWLEILSHVICQLLYTVPGIPIFRAYFVEAKNIGKPEVLAEIAKSIGLPADEAVEALMSRSFKEAVDKDWRRCAELGVNAVPTFLAGRYALVGAHPYEELERLVMRAR